MLQSAFTANYLIICDLGTEITPEEELALRVVHWRTGQIIKMFEVSRKRLQSSIRKFSMSRNPYFKDAILKNAKHVMLYKQVKCAYNRIKKSANSSTMMFMADALAANGYEQHLCTDGLSYNDYKNTSHQFGIPFNEVWRPSQISELQDYFWFTVVRNPYTRLLSAFLQKGSGAQRGNAVFKKFPGFDRLDPVGFTEFVSFLENGGLYENKHWSPQIKLLLVPPDRFDYIAKTENLGRDMEYIFQEIGLKPTQDSCFSRPHVSEASTEWKVTNANSCAAEFYNENICKRVYDLYKADFVEFGYAYGEFQ